MSRTQWGSIEIERVDYTEDGPVCFSVSGFIRGHQYMFVDLIYNPEFYKDKGLHYEFVGLEGCGDPVPSLQNLKDALALLEWAGIK